MQDDKAFAVWMLVVVGGASALLMTLLLTGVADLPPAVNIVADVALGLTIRFAYKWVGGFEWADWSIASEARAEQAEVMHPASGATAGAVG